ncbi:glutathione S-transferase family protein [Pleurocapsa sp. FMAR1]|uniref:hypothetical protein n=1 Tax=Pleurocapsa sp. FMAR1 TaxID=3040204 RepID=UPI0029C7EA13|nr:hypothetical protein [Pleurocapsa sp. FMAR1]
MALGQLFNGKWVKDWTEQDETGQFKRMSTKFHHYITANGSSSFKAEPNQYHYISLDCPWAHRTVILWQLKKLNDIVGLSIVDSIISNEGLMSNHARGSLVLLTTYIVEK